MKTGLGLTLALACALAGCAVPFDLPGASDEAPRPTQVQPNRLFLEEQERLERQRQTFEPVFPSGR